MNELPAIYEADNGLFRRIAPVKMQAIRQSRRDPAVRRQIETEGAGILKWALDGLARYQERGQLLIPESVRREMGEFQRVNDVPRQSLESEWCEYDPSRKDKLRTKSSTLYSEYSRYCQENGHGRRPENRIREDWERLGLENVRPNNVSTWLGVKVPRGQDTEGQRGLG